MRIAYLDCFAGIAGDMFLGALIDAGVPASVLHEATAALNLNASLRMETVDRTGTPTGQSTPGPLNRVNTNTPTRTSPRHSTGTRPATTTSMTRTTTTSTTRITRTRTVTSTYTGARSRPSAH